VPSEPAIAWRNLWRNGRRTLLTAGGVAFAVLLPLFARSMQSGVYEVMIDNGARLLTGHLQVQHPDWADDPALGNTVTGASELARRIGALPGVEAVGQRGIAWALVAADERSFGAEVMGVEPTAETALSTLPRSLVAGRYLVDDGDVVIGAGLARNLGAEPGSELVVLGSARDGGVAAFAGRVSGVFETGVSDIDRGLVQMTLPAFQDAFGLGDESHAIVARLVSPATVPAVLAQREGPFRWRSWQELMPEVEQAIEMRRVATRLIATLLAMIVAFSVFNTFMMTVFERRREFGVLLAVGMRPARILAMVLIEAAALAVVGVVAGAAIGTALVALTATTGLPLGDTASQALRQFHLPDRLYPALSWRIVVESAALLPPAVLLAALLPALRILRLDPVLAMRIGA
jgi:ABC-type lipoprotein release transport system permease subunit